MLQSKAALSFFALVQLASAGTFVDTAHAAALPTSTAGISVAMDEGSGVYTVKAANPAWTFSGSLGASARDIKVEQGSDSIGPYTEMTFRWASSAEMLGAIREYTDKPLVRFSFTTTQPMSRLGSDFPAFTIFPQNLHALSYKEQAMSPPAFDLENNGTPWFLFDDSGNTAVLSAGSDFLVSKMHGDGKTLIGSGLNDRLSGILANFTHTSWLAVGSGIESTIHTWGRAITDLSGKPYPPDDADLVTKYLGYWTDNGAYYYYNYDLALGYAGTILAVADHYRQAKIPIHYMQLDSWWYQKTQISPEGKDGGAKNAKLPHGSWNAYGGTLDYSASPDLFPKGLSAFQKALGLPLVVHGRWIDPTSPYNKIYKISGVAPVDPRWWNDRASYLKESGVATYEQDWLNVIYGDSPAMYNTLHTGDEFADDMADAMKQHGQTLQYCMPVPRFFLQGTKYDNLTTIRTSDDRFERDRWNNFLYTSILAHSLNVRPWVDVFMSTELANLTIAVLSSGPVGIGDKIGAESRDNIMQAVREDGVIVKPDAPLLPTDATIIADADSSHQPLIASTYTDNGQRTAYVFAYTRKGDTPGVSFTPASLGFKGKVYIYSPSARAGHVIEAAAAAKDTLGPEGWADYIVAPIGRSGIAFLGDANKIVGTGRQRIASVADGPKKLIVTVATALGETLVTLHGYSASPPKAIYSDGRALHVNYDKSTNLFSFQVSTPPAYVVNGVMPESLSTKVIIQTGN